MLIVRNMIESDLEAIASLEKNIFSDAWTAKSIEDTYNQPQAFIMMAELEGKLAGYCIVYFVLDEGEIARIAVDSSFRRQGVHLSSDFQPVLPLLSGLLPVLLQRLPGMVSYHPAYHP